MSLRPLYAAALLCGIVLAAACSPGPDAPASPSVAAPAFAPPVPPAAVSPLQDTSPADPDKVQLGRRLFADGRLSADGSLSCASCHDVANGGDDGRRYSTGVDGEPTRLNTPTVLNSALNFAQFWDGRARTLEAQIRETLSSAEMGSGAEQAAAALASDTALVARFRRSYADGLTPDTLVDALAAYLRALTTPGAPFDRYLRGDETAIDEPAREGYRLFTNLGCVSCHQGRNLGGNLFQHFGVMGDYFADRGGAEEPDYGRYNVTGREHDRFKFKVPTLRNVADTAPYFHDGSVATLDEAVRIMLEYQVGREAGDHEVTAIVAFLETLSADVDESLR